MDLYAYLNIRNFGQIAKNNWIEIPRLMGYRLTEEEEPISRAEIKNLDQR